MSRSTTTPSVWRRGLASCRACSGRCMASLGTNGSVGTTSVLALSRLWQLTTYYAGLGRGNRADTRQALSPRDL